MSAETSRGSLEIKPNEPLKSYTTFKIGGPAKYFVKVCNRSELRQALEFRKSENLDLFVLGGGSNILVSDRGFDGLVIHMEIRGLDVTAENQKEVVLKIGAGETWDKVVGYAVERGFWGIENLSHIPGQAGAALVQNIGAYGQQISDVLRSAEVMDNQSGEIKSLAADDCGMEYRKTIFNSSQRNRYVILNSILGLTQHGTPSLTYPDLKARFQARTQNAPTLAEIREAIIQIRDSKFPFPKEERGGNAGSFFKNLTLSESEFAVLENNVQREFGQAGSERLSQIKSRFKSSGQIKVPTAFLMDLCGLKGAHYGRAEVNGTQPLVLLNMGGATASDVLGLAKAVRQTIFRKTGMKLRLEPELVGFANSEIEQLYALD